MKEDRAISTHPSIIVRPMTGADRDLDGALALSQAVSWPYRKDDWRVALELGHGLLAEADGAIVASILWWPYGDAFATCGIIIVSPAMQGRGLGRTLMEQMLHKKLQSYAVAGAKWLHLVDLDGAKNPKNRQISLICKIIEETGLNVQVGGGIRSFDDVKTLITAGASRVVIGSLAVRDTLTTKRIFDAFGPEKICLAADVIRQNSSFNIAVSGWQEASSLDLFTFIETYLESGLRHTLCTDVDRDGTLAGCNRDLYRMVKQAFPKLSLQASGGVSVLDDLVGLPADGVIIGKALYEGRFNVKEALDAVRC